MRDWSRRRALHLTGSAALTAVAGCAGTDTARGPPPGTTATPVTDLTVLKVRHTEPVPMVAERRDEATTTTTRQPRHRGRLRIHVAGLGESDRRPAFLDVPGADRLRAFHEETNFEHASIYLVQSAIAACHERHLTGVYRTRDSVDVAFCRRSRPADVACAVDSVDMLAFAIRLPFPADGFRGHGGSERADCEFASTVEPDADLTVGPDGGTAE